MHNFIKIVVAGDVDSGKSTLIGRYLYESGSLYQGAVNDIQQVCKNLERNFEFAYLLDSFQEEREKELTIDTTQCFCKTEKNNSIVFIDVPGHQELLKNMLSGASCADTAMPTPARCFSRKRKKRLTELRQMAGAGRSFAPRRARRRRSRFERRKMIELGN